MAERPTFSQSWSRVSHLAPALRPQVEVHRHLFRGEPWHVVHDPVSNSFFRLNPVAYHFVGLLDGRRNVDDAWRLTLDRFGDAAPTQNEVIGLLGQLNESNLLRVDLPADAEPLLRRSGQRRLKWWAGQAMSILFIRIPIFNPDRLVTWLLPLTKWMMTKWGMMVWFAWVAFGIYKFIPHAGVFVRDATSILAPTNWGWMIILFLVLKAIHELGHGLVCKRFGGVVPEMGIMMLVLFPAPYVDATSAWAIPSKWKRFLVGSAGMVFELFVAAAAIHLWINAAEGSLLRQLTYNVIFMASVSTILFNANPLLRFDGYYMLSDLLEVPNLYQRAQNQMKYLIKKYIYGMGNTPPVSTSFKEQFWLIFYGIAALIYRVVILFGIILFVSGKMFNLGLAIAAWSFFAWGVVPLCKFIHWLATHPSLHEKRFRAWSTMIVFATALFVTFGMILWPDHRRTPGIIESAARADIAVHTDGWVKQVNVTSGQQVKEGDILLEAENPILESKVVELEAERRRLMLARGKALADDDQTLKAQYDDQIRSKSETIEELRRRLGALVLRSPINGTIQVPDIHKLAGQYLRRGQVLGQINDLTQLRVTALVDQSHSSAISKEKVERVEIRPAGQLSKPLVEQVTWVSPSGRDTLPHQAMGYAGGGDVPTKPDDPEGMQTQQPQFIIHVTLSPTTNADGTVRQAPTALPGERVYVRFTLKEKRTLMAQGWHKLRQIFRDQQTAAQ